MYVCICHAVTANDILTAFDAGARCAGSISKATRAGTGCGSCRPEVQEIIDFACRTVDAPPGAPGFELQQESA